MKKLILVSAALAATAVATPALAQDGGEVRLEVRGGIVDGGGVTEATIGAAAGYDFDLGDTIFVGGEVSIDTILADGGNEVFGLTGRLGANAGESTKVFLAGGRSFASGEDAWHAGVGIEQKVGGNFYVKGEYRHFFSDFVDVDSFVVGAGLTF